MAEPPAALIRRSAAAGRALLVVLALGSAPTHAESAAGTLVGVDAAVNPQATSMVPGAVARNLAIGQDVVFDERIATTASGQAQILFLDQSSLGIGPGADVTIDRFVYDPRAGAGRLALSATHGVFRYVGGALARLDGAVTLAAPAATIGIRGGVFLADLEPDGGLTVIFVSGTALTVTGRDGAVQTVTRPGFVVRVVGPGATPAIAGPVARDVAGNLLDALDGRLGASGGARVVPTDAIVANSGVAAALAGGLAALAAAGPPPPGLLAGGLAALRLRLNLSTVQGQRVQQAIDLIEERRGR